MGVAALGPVGVPNACAEAFMWPWAWVKLWPNVAGEAGKAGGPLGECTGDPRVMGSIVIREALWVGAKDL